MKRANPSRKPSAAAAVLAAAALLAACGGEACPKGTAGCDCLPTGDCFSPYVCSGGVCALPADTGTDTAADTDVAEATGCATDGECDDMDPCTTDGCDTDLGTCTHSNVDADGDGYTAWAVDGTACGGSDCHDDDAALYLGECMGVNACCDGCYQLDHCWEDTGTGYVWEDPPADAYLFWDDAIAYCDSLALPGRGAGEWHLPTAAEMRTLIRGCAGTQTGGACIVSDAVSPGYSDPCVGCALMGGPGEYGCYWDPDVDGTCTDYWTATNPADAADMPVQVGFEHGDVGSASRTEDGRFVRCVHTP